MTKHNKLQIIRLTQFSHGSGCGCKIAPGVLQEILSKVGKSKADERILVGNDSLDDAAVIAIDEETAIISTTDFFTPIVDDPADFGAIAAVNAISDIYAMGGEPILAISILGWPVDKLSASMAAMVVEGARKICHKAGINIAGGHSIDTPEPIFGLAVTGKVHPKHIIRNKGARQGDLIYLTKPLGIGVYTTAQKKGLLLNPDKIIVTDLMLQLNDLGKSIARLEGVTAMTDVTGFGLLGHLNEMCEAGNVSAEIHFKDIPILKNAKKYMAQKCVPGGTLRNFSSYGEKISGINKANRGILCDPQTSGGLLIAVNPAYEKDFLSLLKKKDGWKIGAFLAKNSYSVFVK